MIDQVIAGVVTQAFNPSTHRGVDIGAPEGTPVYAWMAGYVDFAGWDPSGGGNEIRIHHNDGSVAKYFHLSKFSVNQGVQVAQGQKIGEVGHTGTTSRNLSIGKTGDHLHFEVWLKDSAGNLVPVDPLTAVKSESYAPSDFAAPYTSPEPIPETSQADQGSILSAIPWWAWALGVTAALKWKKII